MKTILLVLISLGLLVVAAERKPPVGVPADAKFHEGKWYKVYSEKGLSWHRARDKAKAAGGRLVVIHDAATWDFVKSLLTGEPRLWLGASDEKAEGV